MCLHNVCSSAVPHTISTSTLSAVPAAPDPSSTRSAGPDGPNAERNRNRGRVGISFLKMVLFISWSRCARGLVPRFDFAAFPAEPCCPFGYESQSDPGRGQARAGSPRDL
jgi:hypothetical protein